MTETPRPLREIAADMENMSGDQEADHYLGDSLLLEAIERLAPYATETPDEGEAERVVAAWERIEKWYA